MRGIGMAGSRCIYFAIKFRGWYGWKVEELEVELRWLLFVLGKWSEVLDSD